MPLKRSGGDPSGAPKRTRFASPSAPAGPSRSASAGGDGASSTGEAEDQFLEGDITESNRKARKREKRALKDTSGYGSDSSDDEDGVVPSRRPGAKPEEDDADVDMFAEEPEEETKGKGKAKDEEKKEYMDLEEIEGQEFSKRREVESDSDSEEEMDEDGKKKVKGTGLDGDMGNLTAFNMEKEWESGRLTADGETYIENERDPGEKHDMWLDSVEKAEIKKARRAHRERERLEKEREEREAALSGVGSEEREQALMREAVQLMERGETVLEAIQRLGKEAEEKRKKDAAAGGKKKSWAERQKERKAQAEQEASNSFNKLSGIVGDLSAIGQLDVYSLSREAIQRMLPRDETAAAPTAPAPADTRQFQYRFSLAYVRALPEAQRPVEREIFGPFSAQQLNAWKATGFFGPSCENVELRQMKDGEDGAWGAWKDVVA